MYKKYFIQTFGCHANVKDSQTMAATLDGLGFLPAKNYKEADVIIINTCSVRQKSEDKAYGWGIKLGNSKSRKGKLYKKKGNQIIFVTGCMVGSAKGSRTRLSYKKLVEKLPWANYLLAPNEEYKIPSILVEEKVVNQWALDALGKSNNTKILPKFNNNTKWAYVNISTGCDNFCTFCVVPYARGEEKSRSTGNILREIEHLVSHGHPNIMLIGQNVNSWGLDKKTKFKLRAGSNHKIPFANLLRKVHGIKEVEKISFMSSNPFDFTADLIDALSLPKVDRYLHIAVQSGDNEILKQMNRRHTIEEFKKLISDIKKKIPNITFGTDIIVGFPGETDGQFMNTVNLFKEILFKTAYISIYSPRKGTNAEKFLQDNVPLKEKKRRHAYLTKVWKESIT